MARTLPENLVSSITHSIITNLKTTSVVNPLIIALGVITLPCLAILPWAHGWRAGVLVGFAALPLLGFLGAYAYFAATNPDYLLSEDYQFKRQAIQELGDKYRKLSMFEKDIVSISPPAAADPEVPLLPPPEPQNGEDAIGGKQ